MKISSSIDKPCVIMTGFISHRLFFMEPLFHLFTQGRRIAILERIQLVIVWLHNLLNDVAQLSCQHKHVDSPVLQNATDGILPVNTLALEKALKSLAEVFMEAIIINGSNFVLVTQFDIFLSNKPALDDCAYPVKSRNLASFHISLQKKTRFKASWNEIIIQNGKYQMLVTGGLYGTYGNGTCQPFLGSSFPFDFSDDMFTLYINTNKVQTKRQQRHLIDYKKSNANLLAGFVSQRFSTLGFEAVDPLYYTNAVPIGQKPQLSHVASKIICYYVINYCTSNDAIDLLNILLQTTTVTDLFKKKRLPNKCSDLKFLLKKETPNQVRNIIKKLITMENITNKSSPARISTLDHENKQGEAKLRDLMNDGLSSSMKNMNKAIIKKYANSNKEN